MRAWRGPHRVVHTLQDGRVYILDTGQKVHFELLKAHNSGPLEFVGTPLDTGDIAVVMEPNPEHSVEPINDDCSKRSYITEQLLSEASDASLPSRQRHWMDTRLRTKRTRTHMGRCSPFTSAPPKRFKPNPLPEQSRTIYQLTPCQIHPWSAASRYYFLIVSRCSPLHHTILGPVKQRSYSSRVPLLRC